MMLSEFHFLRPLGLLLLLPYAVLVFVMLRNKLSQGNWSSVCDAALLPYLLQKDAVNISKWPLAAGALAGLLAVLALAGPTWERLPSPAFRNDAALIIALDLSRSMDAGDIKPSRLTMARYKIADILKQRKDGQTALLVYAGDAFAVTPLTNDMETIANQLSALTTEIMPSEGSNTAVALAKAEGLFKQAGLQKGHILLVTDGVDVDATLDAVKALGNIRLSVLGVGTADGAPIALEEGGFLKDRQGAIIVPKLDRPALEKLAKAGGGDYQSLSTADDDIQALLSKIDVSKDQSGTASNLAIEIWNDRGPWLLLLVLPLMALGFRRGVLSLALLVLLPFPNTGHALEWQDLWKTKDQQGVQAYATENYGLAANIFENNHWKAAAHYKAGEYDKALALLKNSKTSDDFYNKGNVLAQEGKLEEALKAYEKALSLDPNNADAKYNKELVAAEIEKQKQQQEQKNQDQQQNDQQQEQQNQKQDQQQSQQQDGQKQQPQDQSQEGEDKGSKDPNEPDESQQAGQKPEQKPEQTKEQAEQENTGQQKAGQSPEDEKKMADEQAKQEAKAKEMAAQLEEQKKADAEKSPEGKKAQVIQAEEQPYDEKQQANEQWLKRIPDDPAGLLRRKFKYQYGQREHPARDGAYAW